MELTPKQIVDELDKFIIGQHDAKKSLAIALRNRFRSKSLPPDIKDDYIPKNILLIGSTGVGKTELARRLAKITSAPFVKVEATKFTEVGYVGRDVDSIIRDLAHNSFQLVKSQKLVAVQEQAAINANQRLLDILCPQSHNPLGQLFDNPKPDNNSPARDFIAKQLSDGLLEDKIIELDLPDNQKPLVGLFSNSALEQMGDNLQDMVSSILPKKLRKRKLPISKARHFLIQEEADKLLDFDQIAIDAIALAQSQGIVFIDEIDKVVTKSSSQHDVSREGVQRDLLPLVEGSAVPTKFGTLHTDHILFIAAGAFHSNKPSDLIPELQGRFPIRVQLDSLSEDDFFNILTKPKNALIKQYAALLAADDLAISFTNDALRLIAHFAFNVNHSSEDIGARRLHTLLESLLQDISFQIPDSNLHSFQVDSQFVHQKLDNIAANRDLSNFIL